MTLGPDARALLDAASGGDDPSQDDAARVRAKLGARLAMGAAAGAAATVATKGATAGAGTSAAGAGAGVGVVSASTGIAKALLAVALVGGTAATGVAAAHDEAPLAPQTRALVASAPAPRARPASSVVHVAQLPGAPSPVPLPATAAVEATEQTNGPREASSALPARSVPVRAAPAVSAPIPSKPPAEASSSREAPIANEPAVAPRADSIAEEAALLRAANSALSRGDATTALARLDEHAARFTKGTLREEREAARVYALCAGGRAVEARAAASTFVAANPRSPHAAQVRRACATSATGSE